MVQSEKTKASISAVNKDAFASSLRESSTSAAVGQHKEISVIEHHRKQSLQKQSRNEWSGGQELNAHTGRTAAYGGRDYEFSSNLVGRRSESSSAAYSSHSASRQQQTQQQLISASARQQQLVAAASQMTASSAYSAANNYQSTSQSSYKSQQVKVIFLY
mgnify:FL=1